MFSRRWKWHSSGFVFGPVAFKFVSVKMNSEDYHRPHRNRLPPYLRRFRGHRLVFRQGKAPIHVSQSSTDRLDASGVELLERPDVLPIFTR